MGLFYKIPEAGCERPARRFGVHAGSPRLQQARPHPEVGAPGAAGSHPFRGAHRQMLRRVHPEWVFPTKSTAFALCGFGRYSGVFFGRHFLRRRGTPACLIDVDFHKHNDLCNPSVQSDVDGLLHGCSGLGDSWSLARRTFDWSRMQHQFKASSFSYIWVAKSSRQRFADCTIRHSTSLPRGCSDQESYQALAPWLP